MPHFSTTRHVKITSAVVVDCIKFAKHFRMLAQNLTVSAYPQWTPRMGKRTRSFRALGAADEPPKWGAKPTDRGHWTSSESHASSCQADRVVPTAETRPPVLREFCFGS